MSRRLLLAALLPSLALACCNSEQSADMGPPPPDPLIRLAHYIDGLTPMDVCVKGPNDADFIGPIVRTKLMRAGGVPFAYTSDYISLPAGAYLVRAVTGSMTNCSSNLFGVDVPTNEILAGHRYTLAGMGASPSGPFSVVQFEDDNGTFPDQARVRFLHGVSNNRGSLDFGSGSGGNFNGLVPAAAFTAAADAGGQPYLPMNPVTDAVWSMRPSGSSTDLKTLMMNKVTLEKGKVYTATWVTYTPSYELSLCTDTGTAASGLLPCQELR